MPSFAISQFIILLGPRWVSAEFLCLSTGPLFYLIKKQRKLWDYMRLHPEVTEFSTIAKRTGLARNTVKKHYGMMKETLEREDENHGIYQIGQYTSVRLKDVMVCISFQFLL